MPRLCISQPAKCTVSVCRPAAAAFLQGAAGQGEVAAQAPRPAAPQLQLVQAGGAGVPLTPSRLPTPPPWANELGLIPQQLGSRLLELARYHATAAAAGAPRRGKGVPGSAQPGVLLRLLALLLVLLALL
jgi:hypothetical protein